MDDEKFLIKGLDGQKSFSGKLAVRGAKNAALKAYAASILFKNEILVDNVPFIKDIERMSRLLEHLGVNIKKCSDSLFCLKTPSAIGSDLSGDIAKSFRASIVLSGPILARVGKVAFPHPGGCVIGDRPIDIFIDGFRKMGATIKRNERNYVIVAKKRLRGAEIVFKNPSVTATETLMMAAVFADGVTVLHNVACEPEIVYLAEFLNDGGAEISGAGTHTILVKGKNSPLKSKNIFNVPADRIEAGSFVALSAICGKNVEITNCQPEHLRVFIKTLATAGVNINVKRNSLIVKVSPNLKAVDIKTHEYPGIPTDLQPPLSVFLTQARGRSLVFETVFEGRLNYLNELSRMGADITICDPHRAIISGPTPLRARNMESPDLRAGLAFVIAALVAKGDSVIHNVYNIDRGYENLEARLKNIGADIIRTK